MAVESVFDARKEKVAAEEVVYWIDWSTRGMRTGDTVATSTWTLVTSGSGLTKDNETVNAAGTITYVRVKAGNVGGPYQLRNTVVTTDSPAETLIEDLFITVK